MSPIAPTPGTFVCRTVRHFRHHAQALRPGGGRSSLMRMSILLSKGNDTSAISQIYGSPRHIKTIVEYSTDSPPMPIRLMPLGGSVTYGYGSTDGNGYRKWLHEMMHSEGHLVTMVGSRKSGSMTNNDNEGWRGFRIDQIESKAKRSIPKFMPNLFTINAGSNDCIQKFEIEQIGKRMSDILEYVWTASPQSTIILSTLLVNKDAQTQACVLWANEQFRALHRQKEAEKKRIILADMHTKYGPKLDEISDGTHPNDLGYYKMAKIWHRSIQDAVSRGYLNQP